MTVSTDRTPEDTEQGLLRFLESRTKTAWAPDRDLFRSGGLSSLFAMELVVHIEQSFDVVIAGADLRLDNFRTVQAMTAMVRRLQDARTGGGGG
jgi:methoxymalonate biosynthesis acyl carrier protein